MSDRIDYEPRPPSAGGTPDVSTATGVLGTAHGGTGADGSALAAARVLASPGGGSGAAAFRALAPEHIPSLAVTKITGLPASTIAPLLAWYAPDRQPVADGGGVGYLNDYSGNGARLNAQAVTYSATTGPGSTPCWSFNGSTSYAFTTGAFGIPNGAPALTVLAVVKFNSFTSYPEVVQIGNDHTTNYNAFQCVILPAGSVYGSNFGGENERGTPDGTVITGTWYVLVWTFKSQALSSTNPLIRVNGANVATTQGTGSHIPVIVPDKIRVGCNLQGSPSQFLDGSIAELLIASTSDSAQVQALESYLRAKYGL